MKKAKSNLVFVSILGMSCIWGFIAVYKAGYIPTGLDIFIFLMIIVAAVYSFVTQMNKHKDIESGYPAEDEMSTLIKYKAGYYSFMSSMYMWLFIFLFKRYFPDVETMIGGGIIFSAVMSIGIKSYMTRHFHENQD